MKHTVAATVSMEDLKKYFRGEGWRMSGLSESSLEAHSPSYDISIRSKSFMYHVEIAATDDPSDSDEKVTDEPLEFITKFLGAGGGEELLRHMSTPESLSHALRILAARVELEEVGPHRAASEIRRAIISTDAEFLTKAMSFVVRYAASGDAEKAELDDLMAGLKTKGWKVRESTMSNGLPELVVDVSGIYTAKISVESIAWEYSFEVRGFPESKQEGVTDDPIAQYRNFYKDPTTQEFKAQAKESGSGPKKPDPSQDATVAPKKKNVQEEATNPAPRD